MARTVLGALDCRVAALIAMTAVGAARAEGPDPVVFDAAASVEIARKPAQYDNGEARAWLIRRDGAVRGALWGTLHLPSGDGAALPEAVRPWFEAASDLTVELAFSARERESLGAGIRTYARPDAAALAALDAPTRAELDAVLPDVTQARLSLAGMAGVIRSQALGGAPLGVTPDEALVAFAHETGKPVFELDTFAQQTALLADANGADAAAGLRQTLRRRGGYRAFWTWVRAEYARGAVARAAAALVGWEAVTADLARSDRERAALLTDRNAAWLPRLTVVLASPGTHVVAVGALHLLGRDGLVAMLRDAGWELAPCPQDVCPAMP